MNLGLLIVPALLGGGYWLLTHTNLWRYWAQRKSGYHLFFASAMAGVPLVAAARFFISLASGQFPEIETCWRSYAPFDHSGTVALSILLALAFPPLANRIVGKSGAAAKAAARESGGLVEWTIRDALDRETLIEISTRASKSYIGFAQECGVATDGEASVSLIPLFSGYRHKDTRELVITTHYAEVLEDCRNDLFPGLSSEDFQVTMPMAESVSARLFHLDAYGRLQGAAGAR